MALPLYACLLALLFASSLAAICPDSCKCTTTQDGLHRATCSNLAELYKYSLHEKHHNINILVLSHNNITKVTHELDRLTELVTLDLSTNGISDITKFLHNARKLVHLNLANNRIARLSFAHLPTSISSLDLTNNLLQDVPSNLGHLSSLEHLELDGNPLDCSCENIVARDRLLATNVHIDNAKCETPLKYKARSWLELKTKDICKASKMDYLEMMGDQPINPVQIGEETSALKSMSLVAESDLGEGKVITSVDQGEDDDNLQYIQAGRYGSSLSLMEGSGSGDNEITTMSGIEPVYRKKTYKSNFAEEDAIPADVSHTTEEPIEGSGEGSGFIFPDRFGGDYEEKSEKPLETTTKALEELNPGPVTRIFDDDINDTSEFPVPRPPSIYQGGAKWHSDEEPVIVTEKAVTQEAPKDTTVSEQIRVTQASEVLGQAPTGEEKVTHKTGTYVCIALIVVLLVGLIGFAIIKGQMRKRKDRRLLRQQKRDVEKASKEMVDMNKSLLGKPALSDTPTDRIVNGKYELVPTHENNQKKGENGVGNGHNHSSGNKDERTNSPRDTNQNKRSSIDNNLTEDNELPQHETSFESDPTSPDSRKDRHSLSSEDIFVPAHDDDQPRLNGNASDVSHPLINGDQNTDSDFLSPSREYVPVYSPDMGRVRIKMSETPKPKTPVLVTRSRSNAGDIIITPAVDESVRKPTT